MWHDFILKKLVLIVKLKNYFETFKTKLQIV